MSFFVQYASPSTLLFTNSWSMKNIFFFAGAKDLPPARFLTSPKFASTDITSTPSPSYATNNIVLENHHLDALYVLRCYVTFFCPLVCHRLFTRWTTCSFCSTMLGVNTVDLTIILIMISDLIPNFSDNFTIIIKIITILVNLRASWANCSIIWIRNLKMQRINWVLEKWIFIGSISHQCTVNIDHLKK